MRTHRFFLPVVFFSLTLAIGYIGLWGVRAQAASATATATLAATPPAQPSRTPEPKRLIAQKIPAPSLKGSLLNEPTEQPVVIALPPSYYTSDKRYPVIYFLPGFDVPAEVLSYAYPFISRLDSLLQGGTLKEMIVVIVNGSNVLGGSFYVNSPVTGNWEDFVVKDAVGYVDSTYRTIATAGSRGITGHSMGGFGALNLAMLHPDVFSAVYSMSPGLFDESGLANSQMFSSERAIRRYLDMEKKVSERSGKDAVSAMIGNGGDLGFTIAYGAAFSPNVGKGVPFIDYPYAEANGQPILNKEIWGAWERGFGGIPDEVQRYRDNFRKLKAITVEYGISDEYQWIPQGCRYLADQLTAQDIPNVLIAFEGNHDNRTDQRIRQFVLPFFSGVLVFN